MLRSGTGTSAELFSCSHDIVIRVHEAAGNVTEARGSRAISKSDKEGLLLATPLSLSLVTNAQPV
jgi:hypothetical protein